MAINDEWINRSLRNFLRKLSLKPTAKDAYYLDYLKSTDIRVVTRDPTNEALAIEHVETNALLVFKDSDGAYRGSAKVNYLTLSPKELFRDITPKVSLYYPETTTEIGEALITKYGLPFKAEYVLASQVDSKYLPAEFNITFYGPNFINYETIKVTVERSNLSIEASITDVILESPQIPYEVLPSRTAAEFTYSVDFTPYLFEDYFELKNNYPMGYCTPDNKDVYLATPAVQIVMNLIRTRMGCECDYVINGVDGFSMLMSQVVYNGPSKNYVPDSASYSAPVSDKQYNNVLVISFSNQTPGRAGLAFLHYNDVGR